MSSTPAVLLNRDHPALVRFRHARKASLAAAENVKPVVAELTSMLSPRSLPRTFGRQLLADLTGRRRCRPSEVNTEVIAVARRALAQVHVQRNRCTAAAQVAAALNLSAVAAALVADLEAHLALVAGLEHDDDPPPPLHRSPIRTCHATTGPPRHNRRCTYAELGSGRLVATQGRKRAT